jgi:hypothetical protein
LPGSSAPNQITVDGTAAVVIGVVPYLVTFVCFVLRLSRAMATTPHGRSLANRARDVQRQLVERIRQAPVAAGGLALKR